MSSIVSSTDVPSVRIMMAEGAAVSRLQVKAVPRVSRHKFRVSSRGHFSDLAVRLAFVRFSESRAYRFAPGFIGQEQDCDERRRQS
jgi:hypothetical protein